MDHPLPSVSPWRARALVAAAVAALELVVLVVIAAFAIGQSLLGGVDTVVRARALAPVEAKPKPTAAKAPLLDRAETSVVVLNGNGIAGAAGTTAARVRSLAYVVSAVGNAPSTQFKTMVMYRGKHRAEAERLAADLGIRRVGPLDGLRAGDLMGAHLAVVLGR